MITLESRNRPAQNHITLGLLRTRISLHTPKNICLPFQHLWTPGKSVKSFSVSWIQMSLTANLWYNATANWVWKRNTHITLIRGQNRIENQKGCRLLTQTPRQVKMLRVTWQWIWWGRGNVSSQETLEVLANTLTLVCILGKVLHHHQSS